jgi:hypothetical protein
LVLVEVIKGPDAVVEEKKHHKQRQYVLRDVGVHLEGYRHLFEQIP